MTFSKVLFGEIGVAKPDIPLLSNSRSLGQLGLTGIIEMKVSQSFRFGMKFRPLGKGQNGLNRFDSPFKLWYNESIKLAGIISVPAW